MENREKSFQIVMVYNKNQGLELIFKTRNLEFWKKIMSVVHIRALYSDDLEFSFFDDYTKKFEAQNIPVNIDLLQTEEGQTLKELTKQQIKITVPDLVILDNDLGNFFGANGPDIAVAIKDDIPFEDMVAYTSRQNFKARGSMQNLPIPIFTKSARNNEDFFTHILYKIEAKSGNT